MVDPDNISDVYGGGIDTEKMLMVLVIFIFIIAFIEMIAILFYWSKNDKLKNENELLKEQLNNIKEPLKDNEK